MVVNKGITVLFKLTTISNEFNNSEQQKHKFTLHMYFETTRIQISLLKNNVTS